MNKAIIILLLPSLLLAYSADFVKKHAKNNYFNENLIVAIAKVESSFNVNAIGDKGKSFGLMQITLDAARVVGFKGKEQELLTPKVNIKYAIKYLVWLQKQTGNLFMTIDAYNRGLAKVRKEPFIGNYRSHKYVGKVLNAL